MQRSVRVTIEGKVQGVWFRAWTEQNANELGLSGWVRNCYDGSVEAVFSGDGPSVEAMLDRLWDGPEHARVTRVKPEDCAAPDGDGFMVRPDSVNF